MDSATLVSAHALMARCGHLVLATLDERGGPDARTLFNLRRMRSEVLADGPAALEGFGTWLATNTSSRKVREIRRDPRACLYFQDEAAFEGLTLQGRLEECVDLAVRAALWMPGWEMYYPGGLDGGDFTVLRFLPVHLRWYHGLRTEEVELPEGGAT